jgi:predicted chitinase
MDLDIISEFKHLPSTLGIENKKTHFAFLTQIIDEEVSKFSKEMQQSFQLLMTSFKSKYRSNQNENSPFNKIQTLFVENKNYKKNLKVLLSRVKEKFNMVN